MDDLAFRDLMAIVPSPVTIITTSDETGPAGATVGAFSSLSLSPKLVLASLDNRSELLWRIRHTRRFGVNILADGQAEDAVRFARARDDRFPGAAWHFDDGLPRIDGAAAWIVCSLAYELPAGDHTILAGEVTDGSASGRPALVYSERIFGTNSGIPVPTA